MCRRSLIINASALKMPQNPTENTSKSQALEEQLENLSTVLSDLDKESHYIREQINELRKLQDTFKKLNDQI